MRFHLFSTRWWRAAMAAGILAGSLPWSVADEATVRLTFGLRAVERSSKIVSLAPGSKDMQIGDVRLVDGESDDVAGPLARLQCGAEDADSLEVTLSWPTPTTEPRKIQSIWSYLLKHGTPGQRERLLDDPGIQPDAPVLTVRTSEDGTEGFSIGLLQLLRHQAMWLPRHDCFITLARTPVDFATHRAGSHRPRTLDRVKTEPEASLAEWRAKWADFGDPRQPHGGDETRLHGTKGHLTGLVPRHGSLYKFGVDRWGGARPDLSRVDAFACDPLWEASEWKAQSIVDGLPILVTKLERHGQHAELEQCVEPLSEEPPARRGEIPGVLLTRLRLSGEAGEGRFGFRVATPDKDTRWELRQVEGRWGVVDQAAGVIRLMIEPGAGVAIEPRKSESDDKEARLEFDCVGQLAASRTLEVVTKLVSPPQPLAAVARLAALDYSAARAATTSYWEGWLAKGAAFDVPEKEVNDLVRANLWHALMLPRFRTGTHGEDRIDLPYTNFGYGQFNADWPINQAVYVDHMIYGLRGYFDVADEEFAAMYHSQQKADGRVGGFAEWGVYSPSMLYSIARNYLLSHDRDGFERLLPASLKALDWCLGQIRDGHEHAEIPGIIIAPLNDLSHGKRAWGFPNAYFFAGLDAFGRALAVHGHPRAEEAAAAARQLRADITRAFARASVLSPVVPLADGTWENYVPCDAMTPRRLLDEWYPTDVDTGSLHLARLGAIDPRGWMTEALLHDHEDTLFLNEWGAANEPVYNQQAAVYLDRDEPEAAIRAFYSMMACAFSHGQLTPLEHRWAWPQYYMPPSTDGAWFELFRDMLLNERFADNTLFVGQAAPRAWLAAGKQITIKSAPTHFGPVNVTLFGKDGEGRRRAVVEFAGDRPRPGALLVRLRHPDKQPIRSVTLNGKAWTDFDAAKEWVRIPLPQATRYDISASY